MTMATTRKTKAERESDILEARASLERWLHPGDTVYTILRSVSRSGMQRVIGVVLIEKREDTWRPRVVTHPNWAVATLLGLRQKQIGSLRDGMVVNGCGMDMGFHIVHSLSLSLFSAGFGCIGKGCPSNDHSNGDRDYTPHANEAPHWHANGGYALRREWL